MKSKKVFRIISLVLAIVFFVGIGLISNNRAIAAEEIIKWRCPSHIPMASPSYKASLVRITDKLKERTNGRLVLEPYAAGALMPSKEIFNGVKRGMVEMAITSSNYCINQVPLMSVAAGLPMNFSEVWEAIYFHKWLGFEQMMKDECAKHGLYYFTDKVYPTELSLKKPVRKLEDFEGLKLRSAGLLQKFLTSLGAAASYVPGEEIYTALASGLFEGAHWGGVQGSMAMGFYEINKYHFRPPLNVGATDCWLINQNAFSNLPADIQQIIVSTLEEHFFLRTNENQYLEEKVLSEAQEEMGVELLTLPPKEYSKMQKKAYKLWDDVAKENQQCAKAVQILKEFHKSLGR